LLVEGREEAEAKDVEEEGGEGIDRAQPPSPILSLRPKLHSS